jgi:hypothetical protein
MYKYVIFSCLNVPKISPESAGNNPGCPKYPQTWLYNHHLVGGIPTPLKNMSSSVGLKINSQHGKS